jgi:Bacteriocin-protection, YdeI or OmpD-Associated/Domain of unknown function (DUF1905)
MRMDGYHVFSARIYRIGLIRYVDVPPKVSRALGSRETHIPVRGTAEGLPLRTMLVPRGSGQHRMAIHGEIRKRLRVDSGAVLEIALERDEESREPAIPPALVLALRQAPVAQREFRSMSTALRRQIVRYLTSVKQQSTLERRVAKFVQRLARGKRPSAASKNKKKK